MLNRKVTKTFAFGLSMVCGLAFSGLFASSANACVFDDDYSVYANYSDPYLDDLDSFDSLYLGKSVSVELLNKCDYMTGGDCAPLPPYASILDGVDSDTYVNPSDYYFSDLDSLNASNDVADYATVEDYTSLPAYDFTSDGVNLDTYANLGNTNIDDDIKLDEVNAYDTISSDSEIENELLEKHKELAEAKLNAKIALPVPGSQNN